MASAVPGRVGTQRRLALTFRFPRRSEIGPTPLRGPAVFAERVKEMLNAAKYPRRDSNTKPSAPEADVLSN